ncbi:hypothetical protein B1790_07185 [Mycobacterium sp. AT1]|nr:hypothetical protein B1790_07185 [Mycobacterium sp. AT1]
MVFGVGAAAMTYPGLAAAEPTSEPSPGVSQVESSGSGDPDSKAEPGVVSSGGSTPPVGAGSVDAGSGSDASSDPDQALGSTGSTTEPAPGVSVRSSGGALTSSEYEQGSSDGASSSSGTEPVAQESVAQEQAAPQDSPVVTPPTAEPIAIPAPEAAPVAVPTAAAAVHDDAKAARVFTADVIAATSNSVVVTAISSISLATVSFGGGGGAGTFLGAAAGDQTSVDEHGAAHATAVAARGVSTAPAEDSTRERASTFTGVIAAVLAPFVVPVPGSPADTPALWAVLAWVRRQSEPGTVGHRQLSVADPQRTELVDADPLAAPGAVVDRVDRMSGRVAGHVNVVGHPIPRTYSLVRQVDRRLGAATVDADSGQWAFTPTQAARLAAHLNPGDGVAMFAVAASDGQTVDVRAPVDPAEAAVTDTIDVGSGLTYGLAVIGDRLYVLNGSDDAAGNGSVKVVDTTTRTVVGSVEVGSMPFALAARGGTLYVGNADDGTVSVVDASTNTVVDVIDVGANPFGLEVSGDRLYVADLAGTVSVIDLADNTELVRIPVGGDPFGLAATADRVYVTNYSGGTVAVLDQTTNTADHAATGGYPYYGAVVGKRLYVVNAATNALTVVDGSTTTAVEIDPKTRALDAIPPDAAPVDMIVRGDRLYVSNINCGTVTVVDAATNNTVATIGVGIQPGLMAASRDGRTVYVSDVMGGTVRVITSVRHAAR